MRIDKMRKAAVGLLLVVTLTQVISCAHKIRYMGLTYPPKQSAGQPQQISATEHANSSSAGVIVLDVFDARTEKDRLGTSRNAFGADFLDFVTEGNVTAWVEDAFAYQLTKAGYSVLRKGSESTNDAETGLIVDIQKVFGVASYTYNAEVLLQVTLNRKSQGLVTKQYQGTGRGGLNWASTGKSLAESLALALEDAISKMLVDFYLAEQP